MFAATALTNQYKIKSSIWIFRLPAFDRLKFIQANPIRPSAD